MPVVRPDTEKPRGRLSCESPLGILEFPDPVSAAFPPVFEVFANFRGLCERLLANGPRGV